MKTTKTGIVMLALMALATPLSAQAGPGPDREHRGMRAGPEGRGPEVERVLAQREEMALREDQIAALNKLREEAMGERIARMAEMQTLRSRVRAGELEAEEMRSSMEERREQMQARAQVHRERLESILDEDQQAKLQELRAFHQGKREGMRQQRGQRPGEGRGSRGGRSGRGPGAQPDAR